MEDHIEKRGDRYRAYVTRGGRVLRSKWVSLDEAKAERDRLLSPERETSVATWPSLPEPDHNDLWLAFENLQDRLRTLDNEVDEAEIALDDNKPVLFLWWADVHIGHQHCDMKKVRSDLQRVPQTPGCYLLAGGDLFDNVITHSPSGTQFEQITKPSIQKELVEQALRWTNGRVKAMCLGNHEARSIRDDDFDPTAYFTKKIHAVNFGDFGMLKVKLQGAEYLILMAHRFRMNSSFNKTHAAKRLMDFVGDADVVLTAHNHDPAAEMAEVRQRARVFAQAGTYLVRSRYGKSLGFTPGKPTMPGVILFPGEKRLLHVYDGFGDGIHILSSYRNDFKCECEWCRATPPS